MLVGRRNQYDVTDTVRVSHPFVTCDAICQVVEQVYPGTDVQVLQDAFQVYAELYTGEMPGFVGCDTWYHDAQHSLDAALTTARAIAGHDMSEPEAKRLGPQRMLLGILIAAFHDAGYIRGAGDEAHQHGAEFTQTHVARSGRFLAQLLPELGFAKDVELAQQLVHFTGYEISLDKLDVNDPADRMVGYCLGSADLLSQMADRCYLEKCYHYLYREFLLCGMAGPGTPYESPEELMRKTPGFNRMVWDDRLDGYFEGAHRYLGAYFGGDNPYVQQINVFMEHMEELAGEADILSHLRRRPTIIDAAKLREILEEQDIIDEQRRFPPTASIVAYPASMSAAVIG